MLLLDISFNGIDDSCCPFNYEWLQTIFLVEICVHILLKRLLTYFIFFAFFVKFDFLRINVRDCVFQLLKSQHTSLCAANRGSAASSCITYFSRVWLGAPGRARRLAGSCRRLSIT